MPKVKKNQWTDGQLVSAKEAVGSGMSIRWCCLKIWHSKEYPSVSFEGEMHKVVWWPEHCTYDGRGERNSGLVHCSFCRNWDFPSPKI